MSRVLPILFNTDMTRAILDDRKGATRRIVKGFIPNDAMWGFTAFTQKGYISCRGTFADGYGEKFFKMPCQSGDIMYVRETWSELSFGYVYKADGENIDHLGNVIRWRPSIHMPKEAARIWLKVKDVRVEQLREITPDDAVREGTKDTFPPLAVDEFRDIWNSTIKKSDLDLYGWDASPWVWVIEFERCEKPEV